MFEIQSIVYLFLFRFQLNASSDVNRCAIFLFHAGGDPVGGLQYVANAIPTVMDPFAFEFVPYGMNNAVSQQGQEQMPIDSGLFLMVDGSQSQFRL